MLKNPKHRETVQQIRSGVEKTISEVEKKFVEHPQEAGETYLQHQWFTVKMGMRLFFTSVVLLIHGIFPFLFVKTASQQIEIIYSIMKSRIPKKRREELDALDFRYGADI